MTVNLNEPSSGGAEGTRAEMTGPEIKTGRTFWKLYVVLFLVIVAALAVIAGVMLSDSAEKPSPPPAVKPSETVGPNSRPEPATEEEDSVPAAAEPESPVEITSESKGGSQALAQNSSPNPVKVGDIYQDQDGVWRNRPPAVTDTALSEFYQDENGVWHNRQPVTAAPSASPATGLAGIFSQMTNPENRPESAAPFSFPTGMADMLNMGAPADGTNLGGLLTSGVLQALGAGDLLSSGSLEALSGLFNSAGGLDSLGLGGASGLGAGDISGLFNMFEGVLGGQSGLTGGFSGGKTTAAPPPRVNVISSGSALRGLPSASSPAKKSGDSGFRLEGYERFDPAKAGQIESDWEFFVGDYPE